MELYKRIQRAVEDHFEGKPVFTGEAGTNVPRVPGYAASPRPAPPIPHDGKSPKTWEDHHRETAEAAKAQVPPEGEPPLPPELEALSNKSTRHREEVLRLAKEFASMKSIPGFQLSLTQYVMTNLRTLGL